MRRPLALDGLTGAVAFESAVARAAQRLRPSMVAITLGRTIYCVEPIEVVRTRPALLSHEWAHAEQWARLGILGGLWALLVGALRHRAWHAHPLEVEAKARQDDPARQAALNAQIA